MVPVGFAHHKEKQDENLMPGMQVKIPNIISNLENAYQKSESYSDSPISKDYPIVTKEYESALTQLGTLGGGNHFLEIQRSTNFAEGDNNIWIMLHSGSRNLGLKVANHYNTIAKGLNKKWHSAVDPKADLAFLPVDSKEGQLYLTEMQYCVDFAFANRALMMEKVKEAFIDELHGRVQFEPMINIAHNYVTQEHHFGKDVWVHRKGATLARKGVKGIIPGSQRTSSYIVEGLGNPESFNSCSHGAGRIMSRTKAKNVLNLEEEIALMNDKGIIHDLNNVEDLDEAGGAYKDIDAVMKDQKDLVKILVALEPKGVIKAKSKARKKK